MTNNWKKYILWFAQEHVDFRNAEFNSIVKLFRIPYRLLSDNLTKPFWIVEFPNDEAALTYASRSVGLRCVFDLWSHSNTWTNFHQQLREYIKNKENETYNKHFTHHEKIEKIESLNYLPLEGIVDLKSPQVQWWYIEFWGLDPKNVPSTPDDVLFGRFLGNGQRDLIKKLSLKRRKFIGNTSMDAQLSLLMANQALVQDGDLVFDPFVGTGSLLVSAATFGAYVLGADIDYMMLHARSKPTRIKQRVREKDESVLSNLKQYDCADRYLDVVVSDFSNPLWRPGLKLDAIITDPPYGIREATEKVETKQSSRENTRTVDMPHYPSTSHYSLQHLYADLLNFAVQHLRLGGRLVFWLPFHREDYDEQSLPQHSCLTLISNSEQPLSGITSRRLLTYEKTFEPASFEPEQPTIGIVNSDFRARYFNNDTESRSERRIRKAELREQGRIEALKRGKTLKDGRELKNTLNKCRFS